MVGECNLTCKHIHLSPCVAPDLNIPNSIGGLSPPPRVQRILNLEDFIDSSMKFSFRVSRAIFKSRERLAMLAITFVHLTPELFIPDYSEIVRSHLEYCVRT